MTILFLLGIGVCCFGMEQVYKYDRYIQREFRRKDKVIADMKKYGGGLRDKETNQFISVDEWMRKYN